MSERIKAKLGEDLYNQVTAILKPTEFDLLEGYIPKNRFNEVNSEVKTLREQIEIHKKNIDDTKKLLESSEEFKTKYTELENKYSTDLQLKDKEIANISKISKIKEHLSKEGAKHVDLLLPKISLDTIKIDGDNLIGITDIVTNLKNSYGDLFKSETNNSNTDTKPSEKPPVTGESDWAKVFEKL